MQPKSPQRKTRGRLGRDVQSKIGQQLRSMYDDVVSEGVPDRLPEMLRQLDEGRKRGPAHEQLKIPLCVNKCWGSAQLRAFAISLSGNVDRADDLVQEH